MPLNKRAWHAGKSSYKGRRDVNSYSIGIEIDNWGWLDADGRSHAGVKVPEEFQFKGSRSGHSLWESYRKEQLESTEKVIAAICEYYNIEDIVGHEDVSPGRKQDPGPALDEFKNRVRQTYIGKKLEVRVPTTRVDLRLRQTPSYSSVVLTVMPKGSEVKVLDEPYPGWYKLQYGNRVGYSVGKYIEES